MNYIPEEKSRIDDLLSAFKGYIKDNPNIDILSSEKSGYIHLLLEKPHPTASYIPNATMLFVWLLHDVTDEVQSVFMRGEHTNTDICPEEVEESRKRLLSYLSSLPESQRTYYCAAMDFCFNHWTGSDDWWRCEGMDMS